MMRRKARAGDRNPAKANRPPKSVANPQKLSSVTTAMKLLKTFSEGEAELGVTTLARRLGVAKSTVYRLATTLVAEGMLEQNRENEKYGSALRCSALARLCASA